jgi:hypothetical protein
MNWCINTSLNDNSICSDWNLDPNLHKVWPVGLKRRQKQPHNQRHKLHPLFFWKKKSILFETSHWPIAEAIPPYQNCLTSPANELKASCYHLYRKETVDKYLPEYETMQNVIKSTYVKSFMLLDKDENI